MKLPWPTRAERERDLADELEAHFRHAVEDRMARGESREEALASARREFGNDALVGEVTRQMWFGAALHNLFRELRISSRTLARTPRFSIAAVLCVAVGIGVTMTIFSSLHAILLRPLPYPNAGEIVSLRAHHPAGGRTGITPELLDALRGSRSLTTIGSWREGISDLTGPEDLPVRVPVAQVTANLFPMLGVRPLHGRDFDPAEEAAGANVVILGYELWRSRFGAEPGLIDATIQIGAQSHTVIGIMPEGFSFPEGAEIWSPLVVPQLPPNSHILFYDGVIGRLAASSTLADAQAEFSVLMSEFLSIHPYEGWHFDLPRLHDDLVGALRRPIFIFQGAALLVLLIACANVAALLLARGATRRRELGIRAAIGADRSRLVGHVLVECVALALLGGLLGIGLAHAGVRLLTLAFPDGVPTYIDLAVHQPVLLITLLVTILVAIAFGIAPALHAASTRPDSVVEKQRAANGGRSSDPGRAIRALVVVEIAASVVLLAGAVMLARTHLSLERSLGFQPDGLLSLQVPLPAARYPIHDAEGRAAFNERLQDRLRGLPGVQSVNSVAGPVPLDGPSAGYQNFRFEDQAIQPAPAVIDPQRAAINYVTPDYLRALGVALRRGRHLTAEDSFAGEQTALINEAFASRYFPGGAVVGRRIFLESEPGTFATPIAIIGVVGNFRHLPPPAEITPALYTYRSGAPGQTFVLETRLADPLILAGPIRALLRDLDPMLVTDRIQTQARVVQRAFWREQLQRNVIATFAGCAVLLAIFGMYGVLSYAVAQRLPELGVRRALGASAQQLLVLVIVQGLRVAATGIGLGLIATLTLTRLMGGLLIGIAPADPITLAGVAMALLAVALSAAVVPAWRAARLDPMTAMRGG